MLVIACDPRLNIIKIGLLSSVICISETIQGGDRLGNNTKAYMICCALTACDLGDL